MKNEYVFFIVLFLCVSVNAQDEQKEVSNDACSCISEIDISLEREERYQEVKTCITSSIISSQMLNALTNEIKPTIDSLIVANNGKDKVDTLAIPGNNIIISDKNYEVIEGKLLRECDALKTLMSNDQASSDISVSDKKRAVALYNNGLSYFEKEEYAEAIKEFKKAVRKDRTFAFAWDMLGYSHRKNGAFKKAINYYEKSLKLDPKGRMPLMNIPIAYEKLEDYESAIIGYKNFIEIFPNDPEGFYGIGRVYHLKGDYENALDNTMKAYIMYGEINSPYARDAEANLGLFYRELKEKNQLDLFNRMAEKYNIKVAE